MLAKLFQRPSQSQSQPPSSKQNVSNPSMALSELAPHIIVHCGIPLTASVLAFDPIQRLLAIGTLDGRIKVIGGDNIEALLISSKALPFKNLKFLPNQGFLVSVSNENVIQVWDLEKRNITSSLQWESNITAFSVIGGSQYMYLGDEYGYLSVLKYDAEEGKIDQLTYHVPPNLISEGTGISLPDQLSIVGVLSQPCSRGNRVLIAYDNGLIVLWDVTEDRAAHVRGYKDLQLKGGMVFNFSNNENRASQDNSLDIQETEKEISSLCWASPDGSVLAVGYVDGDILLWNMLVSNSVKSQSTQKSPVDVVKIQLSSVDRRLPVIVLHWSSNKALNGHGGQLFAYGGEDIGSKEVLTILDLDWSSGLNQLKCLERIDLTLHGSFADVILTSNAYEEDNSNVTLVFVLTNPGQLHFYEYASLSIFKSGRGNNHSVNAVQYHSVIPTVEPYMTLGKLYHIDIEKDSFIRLSETVLAAKLQTPDMLTSNWPLTGGVPCLLSATVRNRIKRIYIAGYQDGSVRIWDATFSVLSLVSVLGFKVKGIEAVDASASVSALDFFFVNQTLAIGNESGVIFLYKLQGNSNQTTVTLVTETKHEVHNLAHEDTHLCSAIYSILNSPVHALKFATSGVQLVAGFECGKVAVLDSSSLSVLFITECISSSNSPIVSLANKIYHDAVEKIANNSGNGTQNESAREIVFVLTRDAHMHLIDYTASHLVNSQLVHPKEKSVAIGMHLLGQHLPTEKSKKDIISCSQPIEAQSQPLQTSTGNQGVSSGHGDTMQHSLEHKKLASQILLCCEDALYFYCVESVIQGENNFVHELKLEKLCSWFTIYKRNSEENGILIVYQTGDIEIRSLPGLEVLGNTSMMSILRWNFKNNMDKTMSASDEAHITLVNGSEFAFVSLLAFENEFRIPESLPCLHDKVLAAAADDNFNFSQNQKQTQSTVPGFFSNMIKGLKGDKDEQVINEIDSRAVMTAHLEKIFSRFPFSDSNNAYDEMDIHIDDIDLDEPVIVIPLTKSSDNIKEKEAERKKLFEGSSSGAQPKTRTREEIIAKYRNTGDAAGAASQAKNKLLERGEKLEQLSKRAEELQSGAEDFASMAQELAKAMEKRKWWNI